MSEPLTPHILTPSSITMLVQVLAEDNSASVTGVDVAPLPDDSFGNQRERVRVAWQGDNGTGQQDFVLYGLPEMTWSEQINPIIPAPAPVLLVESDLPSVFTMLTEGFVASGRRRGERPAWYLREDWTGIETIEERLEESGERKDDTLCALRSSLLEKTAAFHALHWGAERVLDDVYPWLPRFTSWIEREEQSAEREAKKKALGAMAKMPQTIIHGTWQAEHLRQVGDELLVEGWDRVMVGPAAWDVYCLLESLGVEEWERWLGEYCGYLREKVTEFDNVQGQEFFIAVTHMKSIHPRFL